MSLLPINLQLILGILGVFGSLSVVTIGGGQSAVAEMNRQVVDVHHWMTQAEFVNAFAISRMAPGPGALLTTVLGWQIAGVWGAVASTVAIFGPTTFLICAVAHLWARDGGERWKQTLEAGLRPIAAGMILAAGYVLMQAIEGGWVARVVAAISTFALLTTRISPILLIVAGVAVFVGLYAVRPV